MYISCALAICSTIIIFYILFKVLECMQISTIYCLTLYCSAYTHIVMAYAASKAGEGSEETTTTKKCCLHAEPQ